MPNYCKLNQYKSAIDAVRPFEGDVLKQLREYYKIGLTWSSNALEGNTLTISETKVVLEDGLTIGGRPLRDLYETVGHGKAYEYMFSLLKSRSISTSDALAMHRMFYKDIDEQNAGALRDHPIFVTGSDHVFPEPSEIPMLMHELDEWIARDREKYHPVEFAAQLHLKFVTIHPFIDGNGRVSRLLMNLALIQDGYMLAIIPPVCRLEYIETIKRYQTQGDADTFVDFICDRVLESEKDIMRLLHIPRSNSEQ